MALNNQEFSDEQLVIQDGTQVPSVNGNTSGYILCLSLLEYIRGRINKSDVGLSNVPNVDFTNRVQTVEGKVSTIEGKIPSQATSSNQLADKAFVNSSIATNTATFKGTYSTLEELKAITGADENDYAFYVHKDTAGNTIYDRYKYTSGTDPWQFEYSLNNSSFTSAQWQALNSGITESLRKSYDNHIANQSNPHGVTKAQVGLGSVDNTSDLGKPVSTATQSAINNEATARTNADNALQTAIDSKANSDDVYTKTEVDEKTNSKVSKAGDTMTGTFVSQDIYPKEGNTYNLGTDAKMFLNGYIKYLTVQYLKIGGKDFDIVGLHNGLYRGALLYDAVNNTSGVFSSINAIYSAVHAGNFDDIYIGDYILIKISTSYESNETVKMVVAGIDYYLHRGSTELTTHHLVLVPEDCFATTASMNSSNTTSGGYFGSAMYTTVLPAYATALSSALGGHLITTNRLVSTAVNTSAVNQSGGSWAGASNGWNWKSTNIMLLSEVQAYGSLVWSQGFDIGDANQQLPYFALRPDKLVAHLGYNATSRYYWWLSGVAGSADFCYVGYNGSANYGDASLSLGVRPLILFG